MRLDGSMSIKKRAKVVEKFNNPSVCNFRVTQKYHNNNSINLNISKSMSVLFSKRILRLLSVLWLFLNVIINITTCRVRSLLLC